MSIKISEKHLEDILFEALQGKESCVELVRRGLYLTYQKNMMTDRQVNLSSYGIADIIRVQFSHKFITIEVIELKIEDFNISHLLQLGRYLCCIKNALIANKVDLDNYFIKGVLIVSGFNVQNDYVWLDQILGDHISVYATDYKLDGLYFNKVLPVGYHKHNACADLNKFINLSEAKQHYMSAIKDLQALEEPF